MSLKPKQIWALVTDSGCGRLFELDRSPARIEEIGNRESPTRRMASHEMTTELSGRESGSGTHAGDTKQPRSDPHDEAERKFVEEWVDALGKALEDQRFKHLVLVADPRTLGRLRENMGKALTGAVVAEDGHNLTKLKVDDLETRVRKLVGWPA